MPKIRNNCFKTGGIVTDIDPTSYMRGQQGEVVHVQLRFWEPPYIVVRFENSQDLFCFIITENPQGMFFGYVPSELRLDTEWKPEYYAHKLFGKKWHSVATLKVPLDPKKPCMVEECECKQEVVNWVNVWGSVFNVYLCAKHSAYYKMYSCMDSFPHRKTG